MGIKHRSLVVISCSLSFNWGKVPTSGWRGLFCLGFIDSWSQSKLAVILQYSSCLGGVILHILYLFCYRKQMGSAILLLCFKRTSPNMLRKHAKVSNFTRKRLRTSLEGKIITFVIGIFFSWPLIIHLRHPSARLNLKQNTLPTEGGWCLKHISLAFGYVSGL